MYSSKVFVVVAVFGWMVLSFVPSAQAQRGGRGQQQPVERYTLAGLAEVAAELNLTEEQKQAAADSAAKVQEVQFGARGAGGFSSEMQAQLAKARAEQSDKLVSLLNDQQKARLMGLYMQVNGPNSLQDEEVAKALGLTELQVKKVAQVAQDNQALLRGAQQLQDFDAMTKVRAEGDEELLKILTDEQKAKFAELKGKDMGINMDNLRRGNRGFRQGQPPAARGVRGARNAAPNR